MAVKTEVIKDLDSSRWHKIRKLLSGELGLILILTVIMISFSILSPYFFNSRNLLNITRQVSITLIVAIGMTFVILIGEIDLSVGSIVALTGVAAAVVLKGSNSILLAIFSGLSLGAAVGFLNGFLTVFGKIQSFIVTLAILGVARGAALVWTDGKPVSRLPADFGFFRSRLFWNSSGFNCDCRGCISSCLFCS